MPVRHSTFPRVITEGNAWQQYVDRVLLVLILALGGYGIGLWLMLRPYSMIAQFLNTQVSQNFCVLCTHISFLINLQKYTCKYTYTSFNI